MSYDYDNNHQEDTKRASDSLRRSRDAAKARKEQKKKLWIRRGIIIAVGAVAVFLVIFLIVTICKAIFGSNKDASPKQTETKKIYALADATEAPSEGPLAQFPEGDKNNPKTFNLPNIGDDGSSTGQLSEYDSNVYIYNNMALELFSGSDASAQTYAKMVSDFKKTVPEYKVYNMVVPNHTEYALPSRLAQSEEVTTAQQANYIKKVYESYSEEVLPINCYNYLTEHAGEYIYYSTDRLWTGLGAYYAYQAFCAQTGQQALDRTTCSEKTITGFEGAFAGYDESLSNNLDTVHYWTFPYATRATRVAQTGGETENVNVYYENEPAGAEANNVFIYGDSALFVAYNDALTDGKKILVVKDSFGNAFVPFLTSNYKEVHVIDPSLWSGSIKGYMQDNSIDEVLIINGVGDANSSDYLSGSLGGALAVSAVSAQSSSENPNDPNAAKNEENADEGEDGGDEEYVEEDGEDTEEEADGEEEDGGEEYQEEENNEEQNQE